MKFIITLNRLKVHAPIGVYDFEKQKGNDFEVSVELTVECNRKQIEADELSATINYAMVAETVVAVMKTPCDLLENCALRIAEALKDSFSGDSTPRLEKISIDITKLAPPIDGVELDSASARLTVDL